MADPTINLNQKITEPTLADLLNLFQKQILLDLNCHAIAQIQSFNAANQTVTATIMYKKSYLRKSADGTSSLQLIDYPILLDVPLIVLGGGPVKLTMPVAKGDECLILFNDRNIDNWFQSGQVGAVADGRLHSFSDGLALVGLSSLANSIEAYDTVRALLTNGTVKLGVNPSTNKVTLENGTTSLKTQLQNLCTQLSNLTSALSALTVTGVTAGGGVSGPPSNASAITTIGTNISNISTQIVGLLE